MSGNVSLFQWMIYVIWWYLMVFEAYSKFLPSIMGNSMTVLPKQLPKTCFQDGSSMMCSTEIPGAQLCVFFWGVAISWSQKHISHFWWEHVGRIDIIIICKMNLKDCWVILIIDLNGWCSISTEKHQQTNVYIIYSCWEKTVEQFPYKWKTNQQIQLCIS